MKKFFIFFFFFIFSGCATVSKPKEFVSEDLFTFKYIDDFNDGSLPNLIGGRMSTQAESPSEISFFYDKNNTPDSKGYSLKIKYHLFPEKPAKLIIGLNEIDI
ncbi:MAG: hypothetical protein NC821_05610, partial [Candidatus Omnitrophica bacterium]|nr:hypothetical protein [Candidatus Omnitrophota bacterium]